MNAVPTLEVDGVPWLERAYNEAVAAGVAEQVAAAYAAYQMGGGHTTYGRVVQTAPVDGVAAVVGGVTGLVVGFQRPADGLAAPTAAPSRPRPTRGRKERLRGPVSVGELFEWLTAAGYRVGAPDRGRIPVYHPDGHLIHTVATTPGDPRNLENLTADLRRRTGLELRKAHR